MKGVIKWIQFPWLSAAAAEMRSETSEFTQNDVSLVVVWLMPGTFSPNRSDRDSCGVTVHSLGRLSVVKTGVAIVSQSSKQAFLAFTCMSRIRSEELKNY